MSHQDKIPNKFRQPVDPEAFKYAFSIAGAISTGKYAGVDPTERGFCFQDEDSGEETFYTFNDKPFTRIAMTVSDELSHLPFDECMRINYRLLELGSLFQDKRLTPWIKSDEDTAMIDESLVALMATRRLTSKGKYPINAMLRELRERGA